MKHTINGTITLTNRRPAVGLSIKALHQSLRKSETLGTAVTNQNGTFHIEYEARETVNISVKVFNPNGRTPLATSETIFKAGETAEVNLSIPAKSYRGLSLYEAIEKSTASLMGRLKIDALSPEQLRLLASESDMNEKELLLYQKAHQHSKKRHLSPEVFFALLHHNETVAEEDTLFRLSEARLKHILSTAWEEHLISKTNASAVFEEIKAHEKLSVRHQLQRTSFAFKTPLEALWKLAGPSAAQLNRLGSRLKVSDGNTERFWKELQKDRALKPLVPKLELLTGLSNLTLGNLPLIQKLNRRNTVNSISDLAGWTTAEWIRAIGQDPVPEEIQAKPEERVRAYATAMKRMADYLAPTRSISVSIGKDRSVPATLRSDYARFFENNPDFDLEKNKLDPYLEARPGALTGIRKKKDFVNNLAQTVRLFRLSPAVDTYRHIGLLKKLHVNAAGDITGMGFSLFQSEYKKAGGDSDSAKWIFKQAQHISAMIGIIKMQYQHDIQIVPYVLENSIKQDPTWKNLFGSEDHCACRHCKSVYSPAAYLADCLHFLENRKLADGKSVYEELDRRRPDIKHILLNCENANTPMPYIDLVNEVLELNVVEQNGDETRYQTSLTETELVARPEHSSPEAYKTLKAAQYPWAAPFDLYNRLGQTYLKHLGIAHHKLVSLFPFSEQSGTTGTRINPDKKRKAKAILGLNETDWSILLAKDYTSREKILWGLKSREVMDNTVTFFLEKTQLRLEELKALVSSRFVDPDGSLELSFPDPCSTEGGTIEQADADHRRRMLQLVRLQRKLNTDIRTTDHILQGLNAGEISPEVLFNVAQLALWKQEYGLPYAELVSWIGIMPTGYSGDPENHKELYEEKFLSKTEQQDEETRGYFELKADKTALNKNIPLKIQDQRSAAIKNYITGALGITATDLEAIITQLPKAELSLENLSAIYGYLSLSRLLHIPVIDLLAFEQIIVSPSEERIAQITVLIGFLKQIRSTGLSVDKVLFLFDRKEQGNTLSEHRKIEILQEIREGLWKHHRQGLEENEETLLDAPLSPEAFIFEKLSIAFGIDRNNIIRLLEPTADSSSYLVYGEAPDQQPYLDFLLQEDFMDPTEQKHIISPGEFPELETLCDLLHKIGMLFDVLELNDVHYNLLLTATGKTRWIDLNHLLQPDALFDPLAELLNINEVIKETPGSDLNLFQVLSVNTQHRGQLKGLAKRFLGYEGVPELVDALQLNLADLRKPSAYLQLLTAIALEEHLGIRIGDHVNSSGEFLWAKSELDDKRVAEIVQVAKSKYGAEKWQDVTAQLRNVIREQQRDALVAYLLADNKNDDLHSPEDLYRTLLMDVEMSSCTITSRIKLALSSVQLFVQRCLMNLEENISLKGISQEEQKEWNEWGWRKNYRVWEANRKVFLYPENWLEPEWRDDKTPFFKELETELQQNELNTGNAEKAYLNYLYKLEAVSNLEILAMCKAERVNGVLSGYYIFGRTHGSPKTLYFRKYNLHPESFTAWEKIEVDFEGDHLVPVVHNGRLYMFWPVFNEQSLDGEKKPDGNGYEDPVTYWQVHLAWSTYKNNTWSPRTDTPIFCNVFGKNPVLISKSTEKQIKLELFINKEIKGSIYTQLSHDKEGDFMNSGRTFIFEGWTEPMISPDNILRGVTPPKRPAIKRALDISDVSGIHENIPANHRVIILSDDTMGCYIVQDDQNSLIVKNDPVEKRLHPMHYPLIHSFLNRINKAGVSILPDLINNLDKEYYDGNDDFSGWRIDSYQVESSFISYLNSNSYSQYNWELFFHIPMHIANKLRQDQKFETAQRWFHYVFNPTRSAGEEVPEKFWLFKPFRDYVCSSEDGTPCSIRELMRIVNDESDIAGFQTFENRVHAWERDPFSPHTVARTRIVAYMKWVVMRYIDTLVEWADQLFRRDSIESLNEATQLYMLAWNILGGQSHEMNEQKRNDRSYADIRDDLDEFSNILVTLEDRLINVNRVSRDKRRRMEPLPDYKTEAFADFSLPEFPWDLNRDHNIITRQLYFCIPQNEKLLGYWTLIRDRFYKLRNCLNIEGVYRQLPLYEPPVDPALLIKAKAAGLSIADALSAQYNPKSHYRFTALLKKAIDYANDVRAFGSALLSAMEKRDAERMALLRSQHEVELLDAATLIRKEQIKELNASKKALEYSHKNIEHRRGYYAGKEFMSSLEISEMTISAASQTLKAISTFLYTGAAAAAIAPDYTVGYSGWGGHAVATHGGSYVARGTDYVAKGLAGSASVLDLAASMVGQFANYERRAEEWKFQESSAEIELKQIEKQILAAEIRMGIAGQELENHKLQVENSKEQLAMVQAKFTNAALYEWMTGQLKTLYFQSYQMAFDMAKKAEHALIEELGKNGVDSSEQFIQFGYWDNLKEGLLSGEKLHHDLKRMEMIYMQRNKRRYEVSQTFSLAMTHPDELVRLRAEGICDFNIPEVLFDIAYPKHENRRVKSVSITIPAVTGPYTGVHATLSNTDYPESRIATSSGQNDSGLFQFNFNDERYLPFEGIHPASNWHIEMNSGFRMFDYNSISDVLLHIHYTADPVNTVEDENNKLDTLLSELKELEFKRYFSLKNEFPEAWFTAKEKGESLSVTITKQMFPFAFQGMTINPVIEKEPAEDGKEKVEYVTVPLPEELKEDNWKRISNVTEENDSWTLNFGDDVSLDGKDDVLLVFYYKVSN